jgi:D-arabinose 1-dehydrogenase-like Zn-dependent alcohol dehydrogenase
VLLLNVDGTMVVVGLSEKGVPIGAFSLTPRPHSPAGSEIGGIHEIQEMLTSAADTARRATSRSYPFKKSMKLMKEF